MDLVFATNNNHKLKEAQKILSHNNQIKILSLKDIRINQTLPEDFDTFEKNAHQKAQFVFEYCKSPCFSDDSGLEIDYLNGAPGVFSSRFSGENASDQKNIQKVLSLMSGVKNRKAQFRTCIAYINDTGVYCFNGIIRGEITFETKGLNGFGYDPIFIPEGHKLTFSEMSLEEKNLISHRKKALILFNEYLLKNVLK